MPPIPLLGGAYRARSLIASAQRCLNLYPEKNPDDAEAPLTHYLTPGLTRLKQCENYAPFRGLFEAGNGEVFAVVGQQFYFITDTWEFEELGTLRTAVGPVSMRDNGIDLVLVDGPFGYRMDLAGHGFNPIAEEAFLGADRVDYLDTFFIFNEPGTANFYSSDSNSVLFDPLNIAAKTAYQDGLVTFSVLQREVWLFGNKTTEIWQNVGGLFPFEIIQGSFIRHGCVAKHSPAVHGSDIFWLARDENGQALVAMGRAQQAKRVSTRAIESEIEDYLRLDDAVGFTYQIGGHVNYMLTFPAARRTWVFDVTEELWHEEAWCDQNGLELRHRAGAIAYGYGRILVGDRLNGRLYFMDVDSRKVDGKPIKRLRSFPHLVNDGKRVSYQSFIANIEVGTRRQD